jgi:hypothetical protein
VGSWQSNGKSEPVFASRRYALPILRRRHIILLAGQLHFHSFGLAVVLQAGSASVSDLPANYGHKQSLWVSSGHL